MDTRYHRDMLIRHHDPVPQNGLLFYAPMDKLRTTLPTGQTRYRDTGLLVQYSTLDGIPCMVATNDQEFTTYTPQVSGLPTGRAVRSCSFWYRPTAAGYRAKPPTYGAATSHQRWSYNAAGKLSVYAYDNTAQTTGSVPNGYRWHHVVSIYDGTDVHWYVDGAFFETSSFAYPNKVNTGDKLGVCVGGLNNGLVALSSNGWSLYCGMAAIRFYDRMLTQDEVQVLYKELTPLA